MNVGEDGKSRSGWLVLSDERVLGLRTLEEGFEHIDLRGVIAPLQLLKRSVLVVFNAALPVHA